MKRKIIGIAVAPSNGHVFSWFSDGTARSGDVSRFGIHRPSFEYTLAKGKSPRDVIDIGMGVAGGLCAVWYKDGTASCGTPEDLDKKRRSFKYELAPGKKPRDIIAIEIDGANGRCVAWYADGTYSLGRPDDLASFDSGQRWTLPPGLRREGLLSIGVENGGKCYAWFDNNKVSEGLFGDLDRQCKPYGYAIRLLLKDVEINKLLRETLGSKLAADCLILFPDETYYCPTKAEIERIVKKNKVDLRKWIKEKHDCDDFAMTLKCEFIKDAYLDGNRRHPHCFGLLSGKKLKEGHHTINVAVTDEKKVLFIEPQKDTIFEPRKADREIIFILI